MTTKEFDVNSNNGKLMYATVNEIVRPILKENKKQKEVINKVINYIVKETKSMPTNGCKIRLIEILDILKEKKEMKKEEEINKELKEIIDILQNSKLSYEDSKKIIDFILEILTNLELTKKLYKIKENYNLKGDIEIL